MTWAVMIEENVVAEAGTVHYLSLSEIRGAIEEIGYTPRQRNVFYELLSEEHEQMAIAANLKREQAGTKLDRVDLVELQ